MIKALLTLALTTIVVTGATTETPRVTESFDNHWRFLQSDVADAQQARFNDSNWRSLDLPHDWSIAGPFAATNKTGGAGAFLPSGIGWYRKHFTLARKFSRRHVFIEFDGVMQNSRVWVNGTLLGDR